MPPVLLLATMAFAHADDPSHHEGAETPDVRVIVDLALEGALLSRGLDPQQAFRLTAAWTEAIAAPTRARAEGRTAAWAFGATQVRFVNERVADGLIVDDDTGRQARGASDTNCTVLHSQNSAPVQLAPLDTRARQRGPADTDDNTLDMTWASGGDTNTAFVTLQPGESATVVELIPDPGTRPRRRALAKRRVQIDTHRADLRVVEDDQHAMVCLTLNQVVPTAQVPKAQPAPPSTPQSVEEEGPTTDALTVVDAAR